MDALLLRHSHRCFWKGEEVTGFSRAGRLPFLFEPSLCAAGLKGNSSKMELRDIANIAYELMRVKEDRLCMCYEDQLSHANRQLEQAEIKYLNQKELLRNNQIHFKTLMVKYQEHIGSAGKGIAVGSKRPSPTSEGGPDGQEPADSANKVPRDVINLTSPLELTQTPLVRKGTLQDMASANHRLIASNIPTSEAKPGIAMASPEPRPNARRVKPRGEHDLGMNIQDFSDIIFIDQDEPEAKPPLPRRPVLLPIDSNTRRPAAVINMASTTSSSSSSSSAHPVDISKRPLISKCIEVVRNRADRAALPGFACSECEQFYKVMMDQGIVTEENKADFMQSCSRHKARWTPPSTPDGFWDMSLNTPQEWRR